MQLSQIRLPKQKQVHNKKDFHNPKFKCFVFCSSCATLPSSWNIVLIRLGIVSNCGGYIKQTDSAEV